MVRYALKQEYEDFELIVSDNSTTEEFKKQNQERLSKYPHLKLICPLKPLSIIEHFEFALQHAKGDYVLFLTDKMVLLPHTLKMAAESIQSSGAEIVNWTYYNFFPDDYTKPDCGGELEIPERPLHFGYKEYDPLKELALKASSITSRTHWPVENYVTGKICFGCFSRELISRIIQKTGSLFGGTTHDYSAMVQGFCLSRKCILLNEPGILFFTLPRDKSLGSLTCFYASHALKYYQGFPDPHLIINSLPVPGLYASQHNMVAYDYIKYLSLYGKSDLFIEKNWLYCIGNDLYLSERIWSTDEEKNSQLALFHSYLKQRRDVRVYCFFKRMRDQLFALKESFFHQTRLFIKNVFFSHSLGRKILAKRKENKLRRAPPSTLKVSCQTLEEAYTQIEQKIGI